MKHSVGNVILLFLGMNIKAQFGCLAMPEPDVNVNVNVNIKGQDGSNNGKHEDECEGGVILSGQCFLFSSENEKLSWNDAKEKCKSQNARLAVLYNPKEFMAYASANYSATGFWLGASDIANEGKWVWLDGRPISYAGNEFPWHHGEPNAAFENEDCLLLSSDARCNYKERYVCEKGYKEVTNCPTPWFRMGCQCFRVVDHLGQSEMRDWAGACAYCKNLATGADLAQPNILDALGWYMVNHRFDASQYWYWLGGSNMWRWINGAPIANTSFGPGEPNTTKECALYWPGRGPTSLAGYDCMLIRPFVCERY